MASLARTLDLRNPQMGWNEDRRLQAVAPGAGGVTTRSNDVVLVASLHVAYLYCQQNSVSSRRWGEFTLWVVVANGEVRCDVATGVGKTLRRAVDSGATNRSGLLPDDLGHVAPHVEVAVVEAIVNVLTTLAVVVGVSVGLLLAVVKELGDDSRDVVALDTSGNVLSVATVVHGPVLYVSCGSTE
jgi:hypothetical protein